MANIKFFYIVFFNDFQNLYNNNRIVYFIYIINVNYILKIIYKNINKINFNPRGSPPVSSFVEFLLPRGLHSKSITRLHNIYKYYHFNTIVLQS